MTTRAATGESSSGQPTGGEFRPELLPEDADQRKWPPRLQQEATIRHLDLLIQRCENAGTDLRKIAEGWNAKPKPKEPKAEHIDRQLRDALEKQTQIDINLYFLRATLLAQIGRDLEARADYLKVIELNPRHLQNLIGLGRLLTAMEQTKAAEMVYTAAVKYYPNDIICRVNLGNLMLRAEDAAGARMQYEAALRIDPDYIKAHGGMFYALMELGELEAAEVHRGKAAAMQSIFASRYRGSSPPIPVLLLMNSRGGNTPIEKLLDDRVFQIYVVITDFYDGKTPLPEHHLVFNGIGDSDVSAEALSGAESLLRFTSAPVLNHPEAVRASGRCANAQRLGNIPGVLTPATRCFPYTLLAGADGPEALASSGFRFPLLLRAPGFHMGKHFAYVESPSQLADAVAAMPGAGRSDAELLAIEYLDARGADGNARKYRVMMVDGELYPLHLAISANWNIHYFSADMKDRPDHRAEEESFLAAMPGVLGSKAMGGLKQIQAVLGLDYGGIDFGLSRQGEVLLFEANATMVAQQPADDECWDYRRAAVSRIHNAVRRMLLRRSGHDSRMVDMDMPA